jgi:hypothetical protein
MISNFTTRKIKLIGGLKKDAVRRLGCVETKCL